MMATTPHTSLQEFAQQLYSWGASVTAIERGTKRPAHKWKYLQTDRQTQDELNALPWHRAVAVGIINGGGDFRVFDIDAVKGSDGRPIAPVPESVVIDLLTALGLPPDYPWSYQSGSGAGWGVVIRCADALPTNLPAKAGVIIGKPKDGRDFGQLELRWATGQTVIDGAHPTGPGYQWRLRERPFGPPALLTAAMTGRGFHAVAQLPTAPAAPPRATTTPLVNSTADGRVKTYGAAALADAIRQVSTATPGNRNNTLFRQTAALAELVNSGTLARPDVEGAMTDAALVAGLTTKETTATIANAFDRAGDSVRAPRVTGARPSTNPGSWSRNHVIEQPTSLLRAAVNGVTEMTAGNLENVIHSSKYIEVLTSLGYTFRLNELDDTVEVNGKPISDALRAKIFSQMGAGRFKGQTRIEHVYTAHAYDNRYNPIKEYLNDLKWDGQEHIKTFLNHLVFAEDTEVARVFFRRWMLGAVGKVLNQDQNFMLVLDGPQDIGKSYLARWLCPLADYFVEGAIQPDDKDSLLRLMRHWIWEVSELQSTTRRADREALKSFITMKQPTVRRAYGRHDLRKPASASLIGTVNESGSGFLDDRTGNRRFAVVNLQGIDWGYTRAVDVNQLWAETVAAYEGGERGMLSRTEKQEQMRINAGYSRLSAVEEYLWCYYEVDKTSTAWLPVHDIIELLELKGLTGSQRANMMELADILKARQSEGVIKGRPNVHGLKTTSYKGLRERQLQQT